MAINYKGRLLRKKNGDPYLYPLTEALSKREDMYECDAEGKALNPDEGATVPVVATGLTIPPPPSTPPLTVPGQESTLGAADAQAQADADAAKKKVADEAAEKEKADAEAKAKAAAQAEPTPPSDIDKLEDAPVAGAKRSKRKD